MQISALRKYAIYETILHSGILVRQALKEEKDVVPYVNSLFISRIYLMLSK